MSSSYPAPPTFRTTLRTFAQAPDLPFAGLLSEPSIRAAEESGQPLDVLFAEELLTKAGIATIPLSPFYETPPPRPTLLRVCIAKRDETLDEVARRLRSISKAR